MRPRPFTIFHSRTSFLRGENRKSGACYNKRRQCCITQRGRNTEDSHWVCNIRSVTSRCGIRRRRKRYKRISARCAIGRARVRRWSSAAEPLSEARRNARRPTAIFFKRRFKRQEAERRRRRQFCLVFRGSKKRSLLAMLTTPSSVEQKEFLRDITSSQASRDRRQAW